jgi:hypothetical protein
MDGGGTALPPWYQGRRHRDPPELRSRYHSRIDPTKAAGL